MTVERSKRRFYFLSLAFITKRSTIGRLYTKDALTFWKNLGKHFKFVWLCVFSIKTGTKRNNASRRVFLSECVVQDAFRRIVRDAWYVLYPSLNLRCITKRTTNVFPNSSRGIMRSVHGKLKSFVASVLFKLELCATCYIAQVTSLGKHWDSLETKFTVSLGTNH